jgi:hypothetical protein
MQLGKAVPNCRDGFLFCNKIINLPGYEIAAITDYKYGVLPG